MRYEETIVIRCTGPLKRVIGQWAAQNHIKPTEMARIVLEKAFGVDDGIKLPSTIEDFKKPVQHASGRKTS